MAIETEDTNLNFEYFRLSKLEHIVGTILLIKTARFAYILNTTTKSSPMIHGSNFNEKKFQLIH